MEIEGTYVDDGTGVKWVGPPENEFLACKEQAKNLILDSFNCEISITGTLTTIEGWVVDARRKDLDNLKNLHSYLVSSNAETATVRMHDNSFVNMSLTRLEALCVELQGKGITLYQKKWQKLQEVEDAVTIEEVKAVTW